MTTMNPVSRKTLAAKARRLPVLENPLGAPRTIKAVNYYKADIGDRIYFRATDTRQYQSFNSVKISWSKSPPAGPNWFPTVAIDRQEYLALADAKEFKDRSAPVFSYKLKAAAEFEPPPGPNEAYRAELAAEASRPAEAVVILAAPPAETPPKAAKAPRPLSARAQAKADVEAGKVPSPPDFSANTHKPYRKRLEALVALVEAGDIAGLEAVQMLPPRSSSPKALQRYRDAALVALRARAAAKPTEAP